MYTGKGKGKTSAALGLAVRALGRNLKVCIVQFMKGLETGELLFFRGVKNIEIRQFGSGKFVSRGDKKEREIALAGLEYAKSQMLSGKFDILILDEINVAITMEILEVSEVIKLIELKPENVELILTGRDAPQEIIEIADLVTEMREIKHYFSKGVEARKGIEY